MPPEERRAFERKGIQESWERLNTFQKEFVATGRSLEGLPIVELFGVDAGPTNLQDAVRRARAVVRGTVVGQTFDYDDDGIIVEVRVDHWLQGAMPVGVVQVFQGGGPVIADGRPALLQNSTDPVLRKGQQYVLFLEAPWPGTSDGGLTGQYRDAYTLAGGGARLEVVNGAVQPVFKERWEKEFAGMPVDQFEQAILAVP